MDFEQALSAARRDAGGGIGTLGEKTLHIAMKYLFAPDPDTHEIAVGRHIADAVTAEGVIEVQTRNLYRLKTKLDDYLQSQPVTVVYPIAANTTLIQVDENGEFLSKRRSPKHETVYTAMHEVSHLKNYLCRDGFRLVIVALEMNAYLLSGAKKGKRKLDREPVSLLETWELCSPADFRALLPDLPPEFTAKALADILHIPLETARRFLNILDVLRIAASEKREKRVKIWKIMPM